MPNKIRVDRPFSDVIRTLKQVGLRPTRQRLALARSLFGGLSRHVTADILYEEVQQAQAISLATVYNTLHQFTDAGLLKEVVVNSGLTYFDTNISEHFHYFYVKDGRLEDVPDGMIVIDRLPEPQKGKKFSHIGLVIHVVEDENFDEMSL